MVIITLEIIGMGDFVAGSQGAYNRAESYQVQRARNRFMREASRGKINITRRS